MDERERPGGTDEPDETRTMRAVPDDESWEDPEAGDDDGGALDGRDPDGRDPDERGTDERGTDGRRPSARPGEERPFEIHRRAGVYAALAAACLLVALGFVAVAVLREDLVAAGAALVLAALGLYVGRGVLDARTPLFVADAHGVRMRDGAGWVGLLWSEMADLRVEERDGRHDPRIKVVSPDGQHIYTAPLGFGTTVSVREARDHLAARRPAGGY